MKEVSVMMVMLVDVKVLKWKEEEDMVEYLWECREEEIVESWMTVVKVMVENMWEWREEMTLLPEAAGAGMWKPEFEFPGMHCTALPNVRHSCHAVPSCSFFT